jgi:hypothetical protein
MFRKTFSWVLGPGVSFEAATAADVVSGVLGLGGAFIGNSPLASLPRNAWSTTIQ